MTERLTIRDICPVADAGDLIGALRTAAPWSAHIHRMMTRRGDTLELLSSGGPDAVMAQALADIGGARSADGIEAAMRIMRRAKEAAQLAISAADLSAAWPLDRVLKELTALADASTEAAMTLAVREGWSAGWFDGKQERDDMPGLFALAMGKMGAGELNYSSDVDLILLFDLEVLPIQGMRVKEAMTRVARTLVRMLEERTVDGYVFRTDLRLRPDPASTAPAVSTQFAIGYYESVGQNWERMAHIKARVCAGDRAAGGAYLQELSPYVWRRHLDYWAIADVHSIKRQIHAHGGHAELASPEFDVKLGRGGIREIEFFTQVQQLILGGRLPALRAARTKDALAAMVEADVVAPDVAADLCMAYDFLRGVEHRVQMLNDEQTHKLPDAPERRDLVRALAGYPDLELFESDISAVRRRVHGVYSDLFATEERLSGEAGNLVFTGVDDDPGTVATLRELGFSDPSRIIHVFQQWHRGSIPATRSARSQQLLTSLGPRLLEAMSKAGEPDAAFQRFVEFFSNLKSGVQVMSLMLAEPALTREIIRTMAFAPKLAEDLARRPALIDAMLEPSFRRPVQGEVAGARAKKLQSQLDRADDFEAKLNVARRFHREEAFRIGYQLLQGALSASDAGAAYADLADACVIALADVCEKDVLSRFPGSIGRWSICALGKFGGRELTATSDLDLMLIYDPTDDSGGALAARFVQRLVAALSAPTEEGALYEVDLQLRPSGKAGPVAVRLSSFERYYREEAWTWEFMALTRTRPVAGDAELGRKIMELAGAALRLKSSDTKTTEDVTAMRQRMARERKAKSKWDVKLASGGLVDIEFVIQHAILLAAADTPRAVRSTSLDAVRALATVGRFSPAEAGVLVDGLIFQLHLQQAMRIACGDQFDPEIASPGLKAWLANHMGLKGFSALDSRLSEVQDAVARLRGQKLGPLSTDHPPSSV